jgi:hypothetical protein
MFLCSAAQTLELVAQEITAGRERMAFERANGGA